MSSRPIRVIAALVAGAGFATALILSCGDSTTSRADAACGCPASEPPLAGRFVTQSSAGTVTIAPGMVRQAAGTCPEGAQIISGSCTGTNPNIIPTDLVLIESGFFGMPPALPNGWACSFRNTGTAPIDVKATVICLKPGA